MVSEHVSFEELQAFVLDGEPLSPAARQHLDACPACQEQVACFRQTTAYLIARVYRSQCPPATTLSYSCLPGVLNEEEQRRVMTHLVDCPLCLAELAETRQFLQTLEP